MALGTCKAVTEIVTYYYPLDYEMVCKSCSQENTRPDTSVNGSRRTEYRPKYITELFTRMCM